MAGQSNPWAETDLLSGIKLGCPENGLVMARQFSLQRVGSTYVCTPPTPNHLCTTAFRHLSATPPVLLHGMLHAHMPRCSLCYRGADRPYPTILCPGIWKQSGKLLICRVP